MPRKKAASDGDRVRDSGEYAERKLAWLEEYGGDALTLAKTKIHRVYVDLFAGPGRNKSRGGVVFEGSPLRALRLRGKGPDGVSFTDAVLVNKNGADHRALEAAVDDMCAAGTSRLPRDHIQVLNADANDVILRLVEQFHPRAYLLVFADIQSPKDLPWESVKALKRRGHASIDFYMLFPLEMALNRMLAYARGQTLEYEGTLNDFFGTEDWKRVVAARPTRSQYPQFSRDIIALYCDQLRTLWDKAGEVLRVRLRGDQVLYHMLFAGSHAAALRIAAAVKNVVSDGRQFDLHLR